MDLESIIEVAPLVLSVVSIVVALLVLRHNIATKKFQLDTEYATFKLARNQLMQEKLESWDVFDLYGIDLEQANQEGVSKDHILFLYICLDSQSAGASALGISVFEYIESSSWRQRMYNQEITRKARKYTRHMFEEFTVVDMDKYLELHPVYDEQDTKKYEPPSAST